MHFSRLAEIIKREAGETEGRRILEALCLESKGEQVYIPARPDKPVILSSDTPRTVQQRYKVSRSTAYNWVRDWR